MRSRRLRSCLSAAGSSSGESHTPMGSWPPRSSSRRAFHTASGTAIAPLGSAPAASAASRKRQASASTRPLRITGSSGTRDLLTVNALLEGREAQALHGIHEALVLVAQLQVGADEVLDHVGHLRRLERRADHLAQARAVALRAADRDLVPLRAVLVDAEDADVADVVVAAGVHAPRDVEVELADVVQVVEVVETALDRLRDRDRLGIRERAEVAARAADDVGEQADVRRGEPL